MRTIVAITVLLISTSFIFAQDKNETNADTEEEIRPDINRSSDIFIHVDSALYPKTYPPPHDNGNWTQDGKAFLRGGVREGSYEKFKNITIEDSRGFRTIESKEIKLEGTLFLYKKFEQDRAGEIVEIVSYIKKNDSSSVIEVGGHFPKGDESIYRAAIEQAAISAKIIKE